MTTITKIRRQTVKRPRVTTTPLVHSSRGWFRYQYTRAGRFYLVDAGGPLGLYREAQSHPSYLRTITR